MPEEDDCTNRELMKFMEGMKKSLEGKITSLESRFEVFVKESKIIKKDVEAISKNQHNLNNQFINLKREITVLQQKSFSNDVILTGVPDSTGENLFETIKLIISKFGVSLKETDVKNFYRFKNKSGFSPILIEFYRKEIKDYLFKEQKSKGPVSLKDLQPSAAALDKRRIYLKDRLTAENLRLFKLAKEFKDKNNYKFLWMCKSEYLLIQKDKNDKPIQICCEGDLQLIVETIDLA